MSISLPGMSRCQRSLRPATRALCALGVVLMLASCASSVRDTRRTFDTIVIDAGHGGHDSGARSRRGTLEKDVNLAVARRLERNMRLAGFRTVMTRNSDTFIPLQQRTRISNAQRNAIFVSLHFNWSPRSSIRGVESYYHDPYGRSLAQVVQRELRAAGLSPDRGVKHARFHVLRHNRNPAVLLELGFLSNRREDALARSPAYRQEMADRVARALITLRYPHGGRPPN